MKDFPGINNIEIKLEGGGRASVLGEGNAKQRNTMCKSGGGGSSRCEWKQREASALEGKLEGRLTRVGWADGESGGGLGRRPSPPFPPFKPALTRHSLCARDNWKRGKSDVVCPQGAHNQVQVADPAGGCHKLQGALRRGFLRVRPGLLPPGKPSASPQA